MFPRHLPLLARRGVRIMLACRPPLHPIFERVAGIDAVLSPPPDQPLAKNNRLQTLFDAWVPLLSRPFHLETEFAAVPAEIPYLSINLIRTAAWRKRDEAIPCGSWSPIVHTGPGASSIAITRRGIRRRGCFARRLRGAGPRSSMRSRRGSRYSLENKAYRGAAPPRPPHGDLIFAQRSTPGRIAAW
jgi:hypothetical protein